jgi:SAM-dependent methyltransferase
MANCILCNSNRIGESYYPKLTFNNKVFEYRKCKNCRLVFLLPALDEDDVAKLYGIDYHEEFYFKPEAERSHEYKTALMKRYKTGGSLLDYGCGDASFLRSLSSKEYKLYGAEYNPDLVDKLKIAHPGIRFLSTSSLNGGKENVFDIIHTCDVLCAIADPVQVLKTLRSHIAPGGILVIEASIEHNFCLSYLSRAIYFKVRKWIQPSRTVVAKPFRVYFSNRKNQELFFSQAGYKTLHVEVTEWGWPFPEKWKDSKTIRQKGEFIISTVSRFFSKMIKGWGNRFYYIGTPDENPRSNVE